MRSSRLPFQVTVALGASLLFVVQPMAAKFILPWFGGSPSVWSTCLLFFQAALLGGYFYAHLTRRLGPSRQARVHVILLVLAALTLPIIPSPYWKPAGASLPALRILGLLTLTVGLPYVLLSATAPMIQDWFAQLFARAEGDSGAVRTPYRLYALSNAGSLLGLIAYPAAIERYLTLRAQAWVWSAGFIAFVGVCGWAAKTVVKAHLALAPGESDDLEARPGDAILWLLLSFCGTGLLLAVTNELCQNVAVVPLLWIVPLVAYLLTFIICFGGLYRRWLGVPVLLAGLGAVAWLARDTITTNFAMEGAALVGLLFGGCLVCHGELVLSQPHTRRLTAFYLAIALGGSLGGAAVALVAPLVLTRLWEFQFFALLPLPLYMASVLHDRSSRLRQGWWRLMWVPLAASCAASVYFLLKPINFDTSDEVARARNFYGVLTVLDDEPGDGALRRLRNGHILHGAQFRDPARHREVTTYYGEGTGVEIAIDQHPKRTAGAPLSIAVVGLGAGTIAGLGQSGDTIRFYEINPRAVEFARKYFTFLEDSKARVDIAVGDARLSLERELRDGTSRRAFDVIAVDAFSGDAIPVHLLTREAFALYNEALREDGVLAVHVSNHYLDLPPIVRGLAKEIGWQVLQIETGDDDAHALDASTWMLVTNNKGVIDAAAPAAEPANPHTLIWTDSFSSLLQVLKKD